MYALCGRVCRVALLTCISLAGLNAGTYLFVADQGTSNALAEILVNDDALPGKIQFTVNVVSPPYGDILGLFFNLEPYPLTGLTAANFEGADLSTAVVGATGDTITSAGCGGNNMNGGGLPAFDVGLEFGGCGAPDGSLLTSTTLTMDSTYGDTTLTGASFLNFGVRLQAVGSNPTGEGNTDSAKLFAPGGLCLDCQQDDPVVPEPSTWALLGGGLALMGWLRVRRTAK